MKNANPVFLRTRGWKVCRAESREVSGAGGNGSARRTGARERPGLRGASRLLLAMLMLGVGVVAGCDKTEPTPVASVRPKTVNDFFPIKVGDKTVRMQLAVQPSEMQQGLMFRRDLGTDDGMLFLYERPQQMGFWMRNTPTPLDIGFFDSDGVLREVYQMHPFDERTVMSLSEELRFALEMNQGWFGRNGMRMGAKLDLAALAAAVKERGFDPRSFGLR